MKNLESEIESLYLLLFFFKLNSFSEIKRYGNSNVFNGIIRSAIVNIEGKKTISNCKSKFIITLALPSFFNDMSIISIGFVNFV